MKPQIEKLLGSKIYSTQGMVQGSRKVTIHSNAGSLVMHHVQDCCESVELADVTGDPYDLIDGVVIVAEERTNQNETNCGTQTHTFYEIRTTKGDVTLRWLGESNGYYSESVDCTWY